MIGTFIRWLDELLNQHPRATHSPARLTGSRAPERVTHQLSRCNERSISPQPTRRRTMPSSR